MGPWRCGGHLLAIDCHYDEFLSEAPENNKPALAQSDTNHTAIHMYTGRYI